MLLHLAILLELYGRTRMILAATSSPTNPIRYWQNALSAPPIQPSPRHTLLLRLRKPLQQSFVPVGQMKSRDAYVDSGAIIPMTMQKNPVRLHVSLLFWG